MGLQLGGVGGGGALRFGGMLWLHLRNVKELGGVKYRCNGNIKIGLKKMCFNSVD
jgi:hypothetical protein